MSSWVRTSPSTAQLSADAAEAVAVASGPPGQVATLILPADVSWSDGGAVASPVPPTGRSAVDAATVEAVAKLLRSGEPVGLFLGGGPRRAAVQAAARVSAATGAKLLAETFPTRVERGGGLPEIERLAYLAEFAAMQLAGLQHLVVVDSKAPVSFFAYPGKEATSCPTAARCTSWPVGPMTPRRRSRRSPTRSMRRPSILSRVARAPDGRTDGHGDGGGRGGAAARGAIVSDEAQTSGLFNPGATAGGPRTPGCLTGGAIGQGLPVATGAAVASRVAGSWPCRPTAAPCTRSSPSGPRPARASTSRR